MKRILIGIVLGIMMGASAAHRWDAFIVADILRSDDMDITTNVEEANALLDLYEQGYGKQ